MRVLVCGGRDFRDKGAIHAALSEARDKLGMDCVIEGDAPGADQLAGYWARRWKLDNLKFPADWKRYGKRAAGPIRNAQMLAEGRPDLVIAFPGGRGTADMVRRAKAAGIEVREIAPIPALLWEGGV